MYRTTPKFAEWQTPEQRAFTVRQARRLDAKRRTDCDILQFWRVCTTPQCRRNHKCCGNMHACFERHWARVPDDWKEWVRAASLAARNGANHQEMVRLADAQRAEFLASAARYAALTEMAAVPQTAEKAGQDNGGDSAAPAPRIGRL